MEYQNKADKPTDAGTAASSLGASLLRQAGIIAQRHPWYGELLAEQGTPLAGLTPGNIQLSHLPLLTAPILDRHYYAQEARTEEGLSVYRTSGTSTGRRKSIYYSERDDERYIDSKLSSFMAWLDGDSEGVGSCGCGSEGGDGGGSNGDGDSGCGCGKVAGAKLSRALADLGTGHAANTALHIFRRMGLQGEAISFAEPIENHLRKLEQFRPELLYTMPSILEAIADAVPDPRCFGLKKVILVGELASKEWQSNMADRLGLTREDLLDTYGSIEIGAMAAYSHELGMYVLAEGLYGESLPAQSIDPSFEPLREDEGVLVLTSFVRELFPAIRFVTYDVVRDFQTITFKGKPLQVFSCIAKRIGAELKHGEKISLYDIEDVVSRHLRDASLRVMVQNNKLKVLIRSDNADQEKLRAVRHDIEHCIEEIGMMIRGGLLGGIEVSLLAAGEQLPRGTVKSKKLFQ